MSAIQKEALMKMCAVWLGITAADYSRVEFWSQIIGCSKSKMEREIKKVNYLINPNGELSVKHKDIFLITLFDEVKDLPVKNIKSIFNKLRKE